MYEDLFAERLTKLRNQKNVSAREMSLAIGQNASYVNRIENKQTFPSMQSFFYICEYLGISPRDFFDYESSHPKEISEIVHMLEDLDEKKLLVIYNLIKIVADNK